MPSLLWIVSSALVAFAVYQRSSRRFTLRRLAPTLSMTPTKTLPTDLPISNATFYTPADIVSNILLGNREGRETVAFDFHANHGDVSYIQTTVAVRSFAPVGHTSTIWNISEIECESVGPWIILYRKREQIPIKSFPDFLRACSLLVEHLESGR